MAAAGQRAVGLGLHSTEPTTHPMLSRIIEQARAMGFNDITMSSSGIKLADRGYAQELRSAGLTAVILSFPAADAALSDTLLGHPGATAAKLDAWAHCLELGLRCVGLIMLLRPALRLVPEAALRLTQMAEGAGDRALVHGMVMDPVPGTPQARVELLWPKLGELAWTIAQTRAVVAGFTAQSSMLPACMEKHLPGIETSPPSAGARAQRPATAKPAHPCDRCTVRDCPGIPSIYLDTAASDPLAPQEPRRWTAAELSRELEPLNALSSYREPRTAETWQDQICAQLESCRTGRRAFAGFNVMAAFSAAHAVRCELRSADQRILAIIERRERSPRYYLAGQRYTVSYGSETPLKTQSQRKALQALLEVIEAL